MWDAVGAAALRHKTLSAYYPVLTTLGTHLADVPSLVYHSDPVEYRDLLSTTVCAPNVQASVAPPTAPAQWTQQEAIDRLVQELVTTRGLRGDALVWGTKTRGMGTHINVSRPSVEAACAQTPASVLRGRAWHILRSRLGDAGFRHLFLSTSLFLPIGNNCYMQLSGAPLSEMRDPGKKRSAEGGEGDAKRARPNPKKAPIASVALCRQHIFYGHAQINKGGKIVHGLPRGHILNRLQRKTLPSDEDCEALLHVVFESKAPAPSGRRGSLARRATMVGAMREILTRHSRMAFGAMLSRCLNRTDIRLSALGLEGDRTPPELVPVPHIQVCRYLGAVLRSAFPTPLVGVHNFEIIMKSMRRLVALNQNELITIHSIMQGLRVNEFGWLCVEQQPRVTASEASKRRELATQFMHWLFNSYLIPLLRSTFYVTETPTTGYGTVYFHHVAWANASAPHLRHLVSTVLEELDQTEANEALTSQLGAASVRFIPKPNRCFRPVINLGKRVTSLGQRHGTGVTDGLPPANQVLKNIQHILTFEMHRQRHELGGVLFGTNEIFPLLQSLKNELMDGRGQLDPLYFAKMDMQSAFDTVKQDKMLEVMEGILDKNHQYTLAAHCILLPPASKASQGVPRKLFKTRATVAQAAQSQYGHQARVMAETMRNAVVADLLRPREVTRAECMDLLRSHVEDNIWQFGNKLYRQKVGIPQGSCLSSLLCSFFYSGLAADYLGWTRRPGTRLLRYIDDFLLVTDNYEVARRFVNTMSDGFPEYGAQISPSKTLLSFELAHNGQALPVISVRDDGRTYLPFCGFLIDTKTLDFSIDPDRTLAAPIRQSFALRKVREPGASFVGWLSRQLQNRNQVAYVDTHHNSLRTVYLNVFVNFAITAMKVPHYLTSVLDARRAALVFRWLVMAAEYTYTAGRARVQHVARNDTAEHYEIRRHAFMFLALSAYRLVLSCKASRFHRVVDLLVRELKGKYRAEASLEEVTMRGWAIVQSAQF